MLNAILKMNCTYYYKGEIVQERIKIIKNYLKDECIKDAVSVICLIYYAPLG